MHSISCTIYVHLQICGVRHLARAVVEIEDAVNTGFRDAVRLAEELADLELKSGAQNSTALRCKQNALNEKNEDNATLQTLFAEVNAEWQDTNGRRFGVVGMLNLGLEVYSVHLLSEARSAVVSYIPLRHSCKLHQWVN